MNINTKNNEEIVILKPNFYGIGLDLKNLFNRIFSNKKVGTLNIENMNIENIAKELGFINGEIAIDTILRELGTEDYMFSSITYIAQKAGLSTSTIKGILESLYVNGILEKIYSKRRGVIYKVSKKGKQIKLLEYNKEVDSIIEEERRSRRKKISNTSPDK